MKQIVLFVEGDGDAKAAPKLVRRVLTDLGGWDAVFLDTNAFVVDGLGSLIKDKYAEWKRLLGASLRRGNVGGVLLILDGDIECLGGEEFCAAESAAALAEAAKTAGGAAIFSVAIVFAIKEYESWLIAGIESLAGRRLPGGRAIAKDARPPNENVEQAPRGAKEWLDGVIENGYKPNRDQAALTELVNLDLIRSRNLRSFRRLESALTELVSAIRTNKHIVSPAAKDA